MAYGKKYDFEFSSLDGTTWVGEIYKDGYGGSSSELALTGTPVKVKWSRGGLFSSLMPSFASLIFYSESNFQFSEFYDTKINEYYLLLKKDGSNYWSGTLVTDIAREAYVIHPYPVELKFGCGLKELNHIRYLDAGNLYTGNDSMLDIILNCLNKITPNKAIREVTNVRASTWDATQSYLYQVYLDQRLFLTQDTDGSDTGLYCAEVIEKICKAHGLVIMQSEHIWHIIRTEELINDALADEEYFDYNTSGVKTGTGNLSFEKTITNDSGGLRWLKQDQGLTFNTRIDKITYKFNANGDHLKGYNLIKTNDFESEINDWKNINEPTFWGLSTDLNSNKTDMERVLVFSKKTLSFNKTLLDLSFNSLFTYYLTALETQAASITASQIYMKTSDKLHIKLEFYAWKKVDNFNAQDIILQTIIMIKVGTYYLYGVMDGDGTTVVTPIWLDNPTPTFQKHFYFRTLQRTQGVSGFTLDILTPLLPVDGVQDVEIRFLIPDPNNIADNYYNKYYLDSFDVKYTIGGAEPSDLVESFTLLNDTDVKNNEEVIEVNIGTSGSVGNIALGSIRDSANNSRSDGNWGRTGDTFDKTHRNTFLIEPYKSFLSDYADEITGTLLGSVEVWNNVISRYSKRFVIVEFNYDLKNDEKTLRLIELSQTAGAWGVSDNSNSVELEIAEIATRTLGDEDRSLEDTTNITNINVQTLSARIESMSDEPVRDVNYNNYPV